MDTIVTLTMNPCIDVSSDIEQMLPEIKIRCESPHLEPGGGGINVSRAVQRLGGQANCLYPAGGTNGVLLGELLDEERLWHQSVVTRGLTRENYIFTEQASDRQFRLNMPGPTLMEEEWKKCLGMISDMPSPPQWIVASGSLPPGVPDDFYALVAEVAHRQGAKLVLDASGRALREVVKKGNITCIKPNLREFKELVGKELSDDEQSLRTAAKEMIQRGQAKIVALSLGRAGLLAVWEDDWVRIQAPDVPQQSKVGAGDSMVAGLVLQLASGKDILEATRYGVAAGTAATMTAGTELCRKEDTDLLYDRLMNE